MKKPLISYVRINNFALLGDVVMAIHVDVC